MRHVIVGCSAAGLSAAEAILEIDLGAEVTLLSDEEGPPYSRPLISYGLAEASYRELLPLRSSVLGRVELFCGTRVVTVDQTRKTVRTSGGTEIPYDRLLLATGARSKPLGMDGEDAANVFGLRTRDDAARIDAELKAGARRAVVLGGGLVGIKAAQALVARGVETRLCVSSAQPLSQNLDAPAGALVAQALAEEGIHVRLGCRPVGLERRDGRVVAVRFADAAEPCDLVVRAKGVEPCGELLADQGFSVAGGVPTDATLRTPLPEVWAAGDVARTCDVATGAETVNAIWPAAVEQGRVAGRNMAGVREEYPGSLAMNSVHVGDCFVIAAGLTRPEDPTCRVLSGRPRPGHYRSVVVRDGELVGTVSVGAPDQAGVLVAAVRRRARLDELPFHPLDDRLHWGRYAFDGAGRRVG